MVKVVERPNAKTRREVWDWELKQHTKKTTTTTTMAMPRPWQSHHLLLLLIFTLFSQAISNEVQTLVSWIQVSPSSPSSVFANWNPSDTNPCKWSYITCSSQNFVTEIDIRSVHLSIPFPSNLSSLTHLNKLTISNSNLTGTIPFDIGDCISLATLDLSSNSLVGTIPLSIGNLVNLQELVLNSNQLSGKIPSEIGGCVSLKNLVLFDNFLAGNLPVELSELRFLEILRVGGNNDVDGEIPFRIGDCEHLQVLGLADTKISGSLPASLGKLKKLQTLSVYTTMLSGEIPPEIGNCSELVDMFLYENSISGSLPRSIGKLRKLEKMLLWQNSLVGTIPDEIGNCENLITIDLSLNFLSGALPESFGKLTKLEELMLSNNNISGSIPSVISNAASLKQLQLDTNQISGSVPDEIGKLENLMVFFAWQNKLEGSIPHALSGCKNLEALDLSHNSLIGSLPPGLFELKNLTKLLLISNDISGVIPQEIGSSTSLVRLRLVGNKISGLIPREIGFLNKLSFLDLSDNHLFGSVPEEIGNCTSLQMLNLGQNSLVGNLPSSLSSLEKLQVLDVSANRFVGEIPWSLGQLVSVNRLMLSRNFFNGTIPSSIGRCLSLQLLDLSSNALTGHIPSEVFTIESLEIALNLSWNSLTGIIPPQISALNKLSTLDLSHNNLGGDLMPFSKLDNLVSLNISYNNFTGFLPDNKLFRQISSTDLIGNQGLCSWGKDSCFVTDTTRIGLPNSQGSRVSKTLKLAIALLATLTIAMIVLGLIAVFRTRRMINDDTDSETGGHTSFHWQLTPFQKLNFTVDQILKCLVENNVIGKGCSGIVYRAELDNGEVIAVKKLWPTVMAAAGGYNCLNTNPGVRDSFSAEVKTLGSIRHKNIVKFIGCCWNKNTRLLMYEYMPNGSLGSVLHEKSGGCCLEWDSRYKIILGAAQGLAYLHHDCVPPIVHRDIKANNILIGLEFEPYIADFGLAKLVDNGDFARSSNTIAGSYGYIAPEYGFMMKITEKSDVYSYGVVVLEVLTGKQPIDPTIPDGLHIVDWVRLRRGGIEVLSPSLQEARPQSEIDEMMQTLGVALLCVTPSPDDRPTMKDVAAMLKEIRLEREECLKIDMLLKENSSASSVGGSSAIMKHAYGQSNGTSFSASSVLYSSSSA